MRADGMSGHTRDVVSALSYEALAPLRNDPARGAILLDIDGTLSPIVDQPSEAHVSEGTRQLLIQISRRYGVVACVSGRRASEARAMVAIGTISYLGSHGAELLRAGWTTPVLDPGLQDWARRVQEFGARADTPDLRRHRVRLEDKGAIVAFHWRLAHDQSAARTALETVAERAVGEGLQIHWGRKVLEIRPPVRIDKGAGITNLLEGADSTAALYVGDDVTDLDAFRSLRHLADEGRLSHVVRVGVRSEEGPEEIVSEADIVVDGTEGVRELLSLLITD